MRRRAGRSTQRSLRRQGWADVRRSWQAVGTFLLGWALVTTLVTVIQPTPFGKGLVLGVLIGLLGMFGVLFLVATGTAQRQMGGAAEEWTAEALAKLPAKRWEVVHDLVFETCNVDHVLISADRVYAVETKWTTWGDDARFRDAGIGSAQRAARKLRSFLRSQGLSREVIPLLIVWGPRSSRRPTDPEWIDGVGVLVGAHAAQWLPRLDGSTTRDCGDAEVEEVLIDFVSRRGDTTWTPERAVPPRNTPLPAASGARS